MSRANSTWQVSASLPRQFCVPGHVTDDMVTRMAVTCTGRRPPVWLWGGDTWTVDTSYNHPQLVLSQEPGREAHFSYNQILILKKATH